MPPRGGIRSRIADDDEPPSGSGASSSRDIDPSSRRSVRQRVSSTPPPSRSTNASLPLNSSLKKDWGKGILTSRQVQEYASGASQQGASGVDPIASAGNFGKNPQNLQRALLNLFGKPVGSPEISWYNIPTKKGFVAHPFMLPHVWLHSLHSNAPYTMCILSARPSKGLPGFLDDDGRDCLPSEPPHLDSQGSAEDNPHRATWRRRGVLHYRFALRADMELASGGWHDYVEEVVDDHNQEERCDPRDIECHLRDLELVVQCHAWWCVARVGLGGATFATSQRISGWRSPRVLVPDPRRLGAPCQHLRVSKMERSCKHVLALQSQLRRSSRLHELHSRCSLASHQEDSRVLSRRVGSRWSSCPHPLRSCARPST